MMMRITVLSLVVYVLTAALPLFAEGNPHAADNMALFEEALRIQGYLAPEFGVKDFDGSSEMFAERAGRYPDLLSGELAFYAPTGEAYYWEHWARIETLNQFRYKGGTNVLFGQFDAEVWKHSNNAVENTQQGFNLDETRHFTFGLGIDRILDTGFHAGYRFHAVDRWAASPVLPDYESVNLDFGFSCDKHQPFEWRADIAHSIFSSAALAMDDVQETNLNLWAGYRFGDAWRVYASLGRNIHKTTMPNGALVGNDFVRDRFDAGVRYESSSCNAFAGADLRFADVSDSPIYTSHLTSETGFGFFIGYRDFMFVDRIEAGFEWKDMDSVRYKYEDPAHEWFLVNPVVNPNDLQGLIQTESPSSDKWYVKGRFNAGPAEISAKYSNLKLRDTATWIKNGGFPVITYYPEKVDEFSATVNLPIGDRLNFTASDFFRRSTLDGRGAGLDENLLSGDLSFSLTDRHSVSFGYERAEWQTDAAQGLPFAGDITQDTWRAGFTGDYDTWDFDLHFADTTSDTTGLAANIGDWRTFTSEFTFRNICPAVPVTLGCEIFDDSITFNPNFDFDGFRAWLRFVWEF
jgi:hypothetical protein